jgi:hypothetical protein
MLQTLRCTGLATSRGTLRVSRNGAASLRKDRRRTLVVLLGFLLAVMAAIFAVGPQTARANGVPLKTGDVLAAIGSGQVRHFDASGNLLDTLDTTTGSTYTAGMCFDSKDNLYVTAFSGDTVSKFDSGGNLLAANFGSGYNTDDESCTVNASDQIYVGQADGTHDVLEFDTSGNLLNTFAPATEDRGTDWVDLEKDQCTLQYTSEGTSVKQFNVCTNTQLPDFATGLPGPCYAHRILADGSVLVTCATEVAHLDSSGNVIKTYTPDPNNDLFAMNLDPDGTSFWTGDLGSGQIWRIDIATGNVISTFTTPPNTALGGLAIVGELHGGQTPTTTTTSLSGGGSSGATITVPAGTSVTDSATLSGTNVGKAGGTVTYNVYSDAACTMPAASSSTVNVTNGSVPGSTAVTLSTLGTYYWTASYSGDPSNGASASACGAETETVAAATKPPVVEDSSNALGTTSVSTKGLDTSQANELVVAYVSADGPAKGGQSVTVSGSGLTWTRVDQETGAAGDAEVWMAHAGTLKHVNVTAKAKIGGYRLFLEDVSYQNATGIGAHKGFSSASGAPSGTITTTQGNSWVWAVGFDWLHATPRKVGSGQTLFSQNLDSSAQNTYWTQSTTSPTPVAGTPVTINDTAPTTDPYDLVLVEIL